MSVKNLKDFAHSMAQTLDFKEQVISEWFNIEETKDGYFVAILQKGKWLNDLQFKALCALMRDLNGDYIKGEKTFRVPGPYPKKSDATSMDARSKPQPASGVAPDSLTYDKSKPPDIPNLKFIPVDAIKIPAFLPTREFINPERLSKIRESMKKHGLRYPIKVRRFNSDYELIDGYLRLKSAQQLGWKSILAEIEDATDEQVLIESLITNRERIEEDPITTAKRLDIYVNVQGHTQIEAEEQLGLDQTTISNFIRLLKLPTEIQHYFAVNNVSYHHGLLLLTVENPDLQVHLAKEIVDNGLSTRQLEQRIHELQPKLITPISPHETEQEAVKIEDYSETSTNESCDKYGKIIEISEGRYKGKIRVTSKPKKDVICKDGHIGPQCCLTCHTTKVRNFTRLKPTDKTG